MLLPSEASLWTNRDLGSRSSPPSRRMLPLPKTLVVEDDPLAAFALQMALKAAGQRACLSFAGDGLEAVEYLEGKQLSRGVASPSLPRLLLLNLRLPLLSGFGVLRWLIRHPHLRPQRIAAFFAEDRPQDQALAIAHGANLCLPKPSDAVGFDRLVAQLQIWCSSCRPGRRNELVSAA